MAFRGVAVVFPGRVAPRGLASGLFRAPFLSLGQFSPRTSPVIRRAFATDGPTRGGADDILEKSVGSDAQAETTTTGTTTNGVPSTSDSNGSSWEDSLDFNIEQFKDLPYANFGLNQHMPLNDEFKKALRSVIWQFKAPIRYAFAYGSGVFPQSKPTGRIPTEEELKAIHPNAPLAVQKTQNGTPKMIDFIFAVSHTQHFHSLNMRYNRDHYAGLATLGSAAVSRVQDRWGAGVYFHPYVVVNGILVKYGVVHLDTLERDLTEWDTLYLAGRLHKPVKILRDDPKIRLANQVNLIAALRTALLLLPPTFTEMELYSTIAGISYLGDPRMSLPTENPRKVNNIVGNNLPNFRRLYLPLIDNLPNMEYDDPSATEKDWIWSDKNLKLVQDMDPVKRGNMVRRLPKAFRSRLYFQYQKKLAIPQDEFDRIMAESKADDTTAFRRRQGGGFERRIAQDDPEELRQQLRVVIKRTIGFPSTTQSLKAVLTAGIPRTLRYLREKYEKWQEGRAQKRTADEAERERSKGTAGNGDPAEPKGDKK